ncbi:uncharacterized protein LOC123204784 isoform X1 [Mangifera indica]|uniref:uncharacterized protein LOC123204784 isoform X1 n=1 Tax=Mangifera indica TaxID=29780 RepID=UPI001CFBAD05|nr:uncharacterized protein LOC123204784 isoform X1 [Mangifera indica]
MDDSGAILSHISSLKDMLDQINEEIEANIQITSDIESEIVKCTEIETALAVKESELTKMLFISQFEIIGFQSVTVDSRKSMKVLEDELSNLKTKRDDILKRMNKKRECFTALCLEFQRDIGEGKNDELVNLSSEKESLENEVHMLGEKINTMQNVMLVFEEEILEDLHKSNSAVHFEIQNDKQENEILLKDIENLRSTLLHYYDSS